MNKSDNLKCNKKLKVLLSGGGTGGHVYPALAVAEELKKYNDNIEFLYIGVKGRMEEKIVPKAGYKIVYVPSTGFPGKHIFKLLKFAFILLFGILKAILTIYTFKPDFIIGTGGFASAPAIFASSFLKKIGLIKPTIMLLELNVVPGKLNEIASTLVDKVAVSFEETKRILPNKNVVHVGYPVRKQIEEIPSKKKAREKLGISSNAKVVFAFGASQGSRTINRAIADSLNSLKSIDNIIVIHGTGRKGRGSYDPFSDTGLRLKNEGFYEDKEKWYKREGYFHDIEWIYAASDLVICRGGGGTLYEVAATGLPSVIIPKAGLSGDHQVRNALSMMNMGAAIVTYEHPKIINDQIEEFVDGEILAKNIIELLNDEKKLRLMSRNAKKCYFKGTLDQIIYELDPNQNYLNHNMMDSPLKKTDEKQPRKNSDKLKGQMILAELSGTELLNYIRKLRSTKKDFSDVELSYLKYRADGYLCSDIWQIRNIGVKLVGLIKYKERVPLLINMLKSKRQKEFFVRIFNHGYRENGFVRRNVVESLIFLNYYHNSIEKEAIPAALKDNYFEVRTKAAILCRVLSRALETNSLVLELLFKNANDSKFEVVMESIRAIASLKNDKDFLLNFLRRFYYHSNWQVREAVLDALDIMVEKGLLSRENELKKEIDNILIICPNFKPSFLLKEKLKASLSGE